MIPNWLGTSSCLLLIFLSYAWSEEIDPDHCPPGWVSYEFSCYKFIRSTPKHRQDARQACLNYNAYLMSVNTMEEHSFITDWLRLHDPQHKTWYTSGVDTATNLWKWEGDDTLVSNLNEAFLPGQEFDIDKKFIAYNYSDYANRWGFLKVSGMMEYPYVCEIRKDMLHYILITDRELDYGLIVKDKRKLPRAPKIITEPKATIFDISDRSKINDISIKCVADAYPPPRYKWYKEEYENDMLKLVEINPMADKRITITNGILMISQPDQTEDRGKYHCNASNEYGSVVSQSVQLGFGYINQFNLKRSAEQGKENWGKAIYCDPPQHFPDVNYYWARDEFMNFVDEDRRTFVSQDGNLYFSALETIDIGKYSCNVQSRVGSTGRMGPFFDLEVISNPSGQQLQFPNNFPKTFPEAPMAGQTVRLECVAFGYPVPYYNWTRKGFTNELPRYASTTSHDRVLILPDVTVEDIGEYVCTASNGKSSIQNSVSLTIQAQPVFTIPLEDMHMDRGSDLYWMCEAFGIPDVLYEWLKNSNILNANTIDYEDRERIVIQNNVMTIRALDPQRDPGVYQCRATNQLGSTYSTGQLRVLTIKPSFAKYPMETETFAVEGGNVTIPCRPEGAPLPRFVWRKDGAVLGQGPRRMILPNGYLLIHPVSREDEGQYTCSAENTYGRDESSGYLRVLRVPHLTERPAAQNRVYINNTVFLRCEAQSEEGLDLAYAWFMNGIRLDASSFRQYGMGQYLGNLMIRNVTFAESGDYECVAKTPISQTRAKTFVFVEGPPGPPGGVQVITMTTRDIRITWSEGSNNGQPILSYTIEGRTNWNQTWLNVVDGAIAYQGDLSRKSFIINGNLLSPWCKYEFRIKAANVHGIGLPSEPSPIYNTPMDKPYKYPSDIGGGGGKVGDLTIRWTPLPAQDQNAPDVWYKVSFKPWDSNRDFRFEELQARGNIGMHVVRVGEKNYYSVYKVKVQAFNSKGEGPISPEFQIHSAEDLPMAVPVQVSARGFNSTALQVSWLPVDTSREAMRGKLIGFRIRYWKSGDNRDNALYLLSRSTANNAMVVGLQPFTYYRVVVSCYNDAGAGAESEYFIERTLKNAPLKPPTSVEVFQTSPTSVRVTWRFTSPSSDEEPLQGFKIRYWLEDQDFSTYQDVDVYLGAQTLEGEVKNLTPGKIYRLRVLGFSEGGDGRMSSPVWRIQMGGPEPGQLYAADASRSSAAVSLVIALWIALWFSVK